MDDLFGGMGMQHTRTQTGDQGSSSADELGDSSAIDDLPSGVADSAADDVPEVEGQEGTQEFRAFGSGHVTEEVQVGSNDGQQPGAHGLTAGVAPSGKVMLFGQKSGLYLERSQHTWSIFSDKDHESTGICAFTAFNNQKTGLKICHTARNEGEWASGNVGISGELEVISKDAALTAKQLHLPQTGTTESGFILRVGAAGEDAPTVSAGVSVKSAWLQISDSRPLVINNGVGNVGVGTTSPQDKLHVEGDAAFRKIYLGSEGSVLTDNSLVFTDGSGWEMKDS